jgi:ribosomal protein S18 acetylase RimI-like enzyme
MPGTQTGARIRPLDELDISAIVRIDERIGGIYRPEVWEERVGFYLRRDPGASQVAELDGRVVGFMLGDLRAGEFGIEEPSGWIERFGIDPDHRGRDLGRLMFAAMTAHFRAGGARAVRTLVNRKDAALVGFLRALGLGASAFEALEMPLDPEAKESR